MIYICDCGCGEQFEHTFSMRLRYKDREHENRARRLEGKPLIKSKRPSHGPTPRRRGKVEQRGKYPADWRVIAYDVKQHANWRCEHCGMIFNTNGKALWARDRRRGQPLWLTVHHLDGNKSNCHPVNLLACCNRCHLEIQNLWAPGHPLPTKWELAPDWLLQRSLAY